MAQTHIINQLRPWRIFFDTYGHLHLHAASVLCVDESYGNQEQHYNLRFSGKLYGGKKVDFHTYPMRVYQNSGSSSFSCYFLIE